MSKGVKMGKITLGEINLSTFDFWKMSTSKGFTESVGRGKSAIFRKDDVGVLHENTNVSYYSIKPESASEYYLVFVGDHYEYCIFCTKLTFDFQYFPHHVSHGDHETMKYIILVEHK